MKKLLISAIIAAVSMGSAQACEDLATSKKWTKNVGASVVSFVKDNGIRYEGLCSLKATTNQYVEKDLTGTTTDTYVRFYIYAKSPQTNATVFSLDTIEGKIDGGKFKVGGAEANLKAGKWHLVQIQVTPTKTKLWVDSVAKNAISESPTGLASAPKKLRLGGVNGTLTGDVYFDSVVASNSQPVGNNAVKLPGGGKVLLAGDANGDGSFSIDDANEIFKSAFIPVYKGLSKGAPDCNRDGKLSIDDANCAFKIAFIPNTVKPKF